MYLAGARTTVYASRPGGPHAARRVPDSHALPSGRRGPPGGPPVPLAFPTPGGRTPVGPAGDAAGAPTVGLAGLAREARDGTAGRRHPPGGTARKPSSLHDDSGVLAHGSSGSRARREEKATPRSRRRRATQAPEARCAAGPRDVHVRSWVAQASLPCRTFPSMRPCSTLAWGRSAPVVLLAYGRTRRRPRGASAPHPARRPEAIAAEGHPRGVPPGVVPCPRSCDSGH